MEENNVYCKLIVAGKTIEARSGFIEILKNVTVNVTKPNTVPFSSYMRSADFQCAGNMAPLLEYDSRKR